MRFEPRLNNVVVPIVDTTRTSDGYEIQGVVGTGFPIHSTDGELFLVSAAHVLRSEMKDNHILCAQFSTPEFETRVYPIANPSVDEATDLAACELRIKPTSGVEIVPFKIAREDVEQTRTVFVHEFSYSRSDTGPTGNFVVRIFPITHKGNVVSHIRGANIKHAAEPIGIYWLSEQMFEGASGAPVLRSPDMVVCGIVLGNQTELDSTAFLAGEEKIKRGFGVAVQAAVVKLALDRMGIRPAYLDEPDSA